MCVRVLGSRVVADIPMKRGAVEWIGRFLSSKVTEPFPHLMTADDKTNEVEIGTQVICVLSC
jgi:hypothetical protein